MSNQQAATPLESLQEAYCLIKLGGDILVVDRQDVADAIAGRKFAGIDFYKRPAGETLMKRLLENYAGHCDVKKTILDFWKDPKTHVYTDIAFSPKLQPPSTLNYWVGTLIPPSKGNWNIIKTHIMSVICSGDVKLYEYLICFLAHMLQFPALKPGIMVVLLGKQGTGKGLFFQILHRIWPRTTLLVSDVNQVLGQFNAALERNFVVVMDEAMFSGDRKSQDRLKSLITEKTCHIEQKYQPSRTIESVHRFFASSNHLHFSNVEADDRRSLTIKVSDKCIGDRLYFEVLVKAIEDDAVIAAMIYDLSTMDISGFDVRVRPITSEHIQQKLMSLQGFDRYWFNVLTTGSLSKYQSMSEEWGATGFVKTETIIGNYNEFDKRSLKYSPTTSKDVADALARLCPSAKKSRQSTGFGQHRGYVLPTLENSRREFEAVYNCRIDWDDVDSKNTKVVEPQLEEIWESELATFSMTCHITWQAQTQ
jgi:hypothetical protein